MTEITIFLFAYIAGSIPFGKLIGLTQGIDIQQKGSGNIGFANVRRVLGWKAGIMTLTFDITKGFIPALLALRFLGETEAFFVGITAIAGHLYPLWLRFRGGKGIATGLGVVIALQPIAAIAGALVYIIACLLVRVSSYGSLAGLATTSITGIIINPGTWWQYILLLAIACWTLRKNITGKVPRYDI